MLKSEQDAEKRSKIINAALKEFATNGYKKASTNTIVEKAGVSKGLLYHYFGNKKLLYDHLIEFAFTKIVNRIKEHMDHLSSDFMIRLKQVTEIKLALMAEYPDIFDFAMRLMKDYSVEEVRTMSEKYSTNLLSDIYHKNVDFSLFKSGIDIEKTLKIVQWTFDKYAEELSTRDKWFDESIQGEIDEYIAVLRKGFYKEEACHD